MSDQWEFFPSTRGDHQAFIFFDSGIREEIDQLRQRLLVRYVLRFKAPTETGMPTNNEFAALASLEDELSARVVDLGRVYVGRVTTEGTRRFVFYWDSDERTCEELANQLARKYGYEISFSMSPDAEKKVYWEELFPTESDWRVIKDIKVIEMLEGHGDDLLTEREIQHWVYFPTSAQRKAFLDWAAAAGYSAEELPKNVGVDGSTKEYGVRLSHVASPKLDSISAHTLELLEEAKAHGGDYDGWQTYVVKATDPSEELTH